MNEPEPGLTAADFFRLFPQEIAAGYAEDARQKERIAAYDFPGWCYCSDMAVQLGAEGLLGYTRELESADVPGLRNELAETLRYLYEVVPDLYRHHAMTPQRECAISALSDAIEELERKLVG